MPALLKLAPVLFLISAICLVSSPAASGQIAGVRKAKAIPILLGVGAAGVLLGYGVYRVVHHGHSLRGCSATSNEGMEVLNEGDHKSYLLSGTVAAIPAGHRVRVSGNKRNDPAGGRSFAVKHVSKDYGACPVQP